MHTALPTRLRRRAAIAVCAGLVPALARANHGPGTSGSGSSTLSGETLKRGAFDLTLRADATWYANVSAEEAEQIAQSSGEFDSLSRAIVQSMCLSYGLTDDLQLDAQIGYYWGRDFIEAEVDEDGMAESSSADPMGLTDLWLDGKWRFARGPAGQYALFAGLKLPTGKDDVRLENGELLEASSQPGTGAIDGRAGLAWSRYMSERVTMDASGVYTLRGVQDGFRVGDRADVGVAAAYRLTEDVQATPNWSVSAELLGVWIGKDEEGGEANPNSGGFTGYVAASLRGRFAHGIAFSLSPAVPVVQDLNGEQVETNARLAVSLSFGF